MESIENNSDIKGKIIKEQDKIIASQKDLIDLLRGSIGLRDGLILNLREQIKVLDKK